MSFDRGEWEARTAERNAAPWPEDKPPRAKVYHVSVKGDGPKGSLITQGMVLATHNTEAEARESVANYANGYAVEIDRREGHKVATTAAYANGTAQVFVLGKCVAWVTISEGVL